MSIEREGEMTTKIHKMDREDMRSWTNSCWWTKPICWSGIRNDLALRALQHEQAADYLKEPSDGYWRRQSRNESRLADLANNQILKDYILSNADA